MHAAAITALARTSLSLWQRPHPTMERAFVLHTVDFIDHCPGTRQPNRSGFCAGIAELLAIFPDFHAEIDLLAIDDAQALATIRWHATGTPSAIFLNHPPINRAIHFSGIEIIRCKNNQVAARWGEWDEAALLAQMTDPTASRKTI